jgi:hypothetical protein
MKQNKSKSKMEFENERLSWIETFIYRLYCIKETTYEDYVESTNEFNDNDLFSYMESASD